ncbi:MAG: HNH endonuclease signature motif containing protein [Arsenophonus sp.]|nr:HNH endonuclease signature motif containing protein [Arsenophonus sp.]
MYQHREVAYSKYGDEPHNCELCNKNITWSTLHVDHIDNTRTNNALENLRLLCQRCNTHRKKRTIYQRNGRTIPIKIGGIIKSSVEWAENDGCQVSRGTIIRRLKSGMSPKEAVFKETRNHISWTKK